MIHKIKRIFHWLKKNFGIPWQYTNINIRVATAYLALKQYLPSQKIISKRGQSIGHPPEKNNKNSTPYCNISFSGHCSLLDHSWWVGGSTFNLVVHIGARKTADIGGNASDKFLYPVQIEFRSGRVNCQDFTPARYSGYFYKDKRETEESDPLASGTSLLPNALSSAQSPGTFCQPPTNRSHENYIKIVTITMINRT